MFLAKIDPNIFNQYRTDPEYRIQPSPVFIDTFANNFIISLLVALLVLEETNIFRDGTWSLVLFRGNMARKKSLCLLHSILVPSSRVQFSASVEIYPGSRQKCPL